MNRFLWALIGLVCLGSTYPVYHNLKVGHFDITIAERAYRLDIKLDRDDLARALKISGENLDSLSVLTPAYLEQNLSVAFNGEPVGFRQWQFEEDPLLLKGYTFLETSIEEVTQIEVINTCLLEEVDGQVNLVASRLHNRFRMFKMNLDRTVIRIDY